MNKITSFLKEAKSYITKSLRPQEEGKKNPNEEESTEEQTERSAVSIQQQEAPIATAPQNAEEYRKVKKKTELDTAYDEVRNMLNLSQLSENPERYRPSGKGAEKQTPPATATKGQEKAQATEAKEGAKDQSTNKTLTSSEKNPQEQKPAQANSMASQITTAPATPKDKAYQLGIEAGRKVGQVQGEGKKTQPPAENGGEKAPVAPAASQQMSGADPNATPTAKNENAAITPTVDAAAKNSEEFKSMSVEDAQQLYPDDYQRGYNVGFDQGYLQGLQVKAQLKKEADAKQAAADKETPAYKDGYAAGTAKISGTPDAKTKGEADYKKYVLSVQSKEGDPAQAASIGEEEKKNAQLFNKGFDEAYAIAYKAANDPKLLMDKKMANPDFAGGRIEGGNDAKKKAAEKFSPEEKDKVQLKPAPAGSLNRSSKEYEDGYRMGFDEEYLKLYNAGIKKAENKEKNLYQSDFNKGKEAGLLAAGYKPTKEEEEAKAKEKASEPAPEAQASEKKDPSKVELWYNKGFDEGYLKIWREKQKENDITNQPSYKKGQSVGKIIGALRGMHPSDAAADTALANNADLKAKLGGGTPPTLKGLEKYLKDKNDKLVNFKELNKEELAQLSNEDRQAYDKALRQRVGTEKGTPAQMEDRYQLGYQKGFDEGYLKSWQAAGKAEDSKVKNNPEYQDGLKQGFEVGKKYLQECYKNLSPDQRKTLQTQVQSLFDEAKKRGEMFEKGFKEGFEKSGNPEEKLSAADGAATSNANFQALVKPYQEQGDTQMVEWLNEHFKKNYEKAHKLAYDNLTESYMSAKTKPEAGASKGTNRVVQKNMNQLALAAMKEKQAAQTEILNLFKGDASDDTNKDITNLVNAIDIAYKDGFILGIVEGQSFVQGFTDSTQSAKQTGGAGSGQVREITVQQITLRKLSDGSNETFDIKQAGNPAEYKKGQAEAAKYTDAAYINERLKSQGAKTPDELELPNDSPVSEAAHKAIEDAQSKWVAVYCALNHLPVPAKIKELAGFTHYANIGGAEGGASESEYTNLYKSPFASVKLDKAGTPPPTIDPEQVGKEMLAQQTAIANADAELFKKQLVAELAGVAGEYAESATIKHQKTTLEAELRIFASQMQGNQTDTKSISFIEMIERADKVAVTLSQARQLEPGIKELWDAEKNRLQELYQGAEPSERAEVAKELEKSIRMEVLGQHEPYTKKQDDRPIDVQLAELGVNESTINESLTEYKNAYNQTMQAALAGKLSGEADAENVQDAALKECVEQMGYINGYVRYIVTHASQDNQQKLGVQIVESYIHNKKISIGEIEGIYGGDDKVQADADASAQKTDVNTATPPDVDVVKVIQTLKAYGASQLMVKPPKELEAAFEKNAKQTTQSEDFSTAFKDGERDAILSYSLSVQNGVAYAGNAKHQNESSGVYPKGPIAKRIDGMLKRVQNTIKKGLKDATNVPWIKELPNKAAAVDEKGILNLFGATADKMRVSKNDTKSMSFEIAKNIQAKKAEDAGFLLGDWDNKTTMTAEFEQNKAGAKSLKSLGINIDAETEGIGVKLSSPKDFELASSGIKIEVGGGITLFQPRVVIPMIDSELLKNNFMLDKIAALAQTTAKDLKVSSSDGEKLYGGLYTAVITAVNEQEAISGTTAKQNSITQEPAQQKANTTPISAPVRKTDEM